MYLITKKNLEITSKTQNLEIIIETKKMNTGLIVFFVILAIALVLLCVMGGCYSANKGKMGFLTKMLDADKKSKKSSTSASATKMAQRRAKKKFHVGATQSVKSVNKKSTSRKTKMTQKPSSSTAPSSNVGSVKPVVQATTQSSQPQAVSKRDAQRRRRLKYTTGSGSASYAQTGSSTTIRGGTSLSASQILNVGAQTSGVHSVGNPRTAFAAGVYLPYNNQIPGSVSVQRQAYAQLAANPGTTPPGYHNDPLLDAAATHGASAFPHYHTNN